MAYCMNCGAKMGDEEMYCPECGTKREIKEDIVTDEKQQEASVAPTLSPKEESEDNTMKKDDATSSDNEYVIKRAVVTIDDLPKMYKPLNAWAYFGLTILYSVPIIGFIFLVIHSFSSGNINRRSYARSHWIPLLLALIAIIAICLLGLMENSVLSLSTFTNLIKDLNILSI